MKVVFAARHPVARWCRFWSQLLFCWLCTAGSLAGGVSPIRFHRITVEDGLSQSSVLCSFQDSRGFMWFGTENGLNRYDGYAFTVYKSDPSRPDALVSDLVWDIDEDPSGDLWIATEGGGVARWQRSTDRFSHYRHQPGNANSLASDAVRSIQLDRWGAIWIAHKHAGLDRLDPETGDVRHYRHDPTDPASLSDDSVYSLVSDRTGSLWVGTDRGLDLFARATDSFLHYLDDHSPSDYPSSGGIVSILEDSQGALWAGTYARGLFRLDPNSGATEHFLHDPVSEATLSHNHVRAILEDDQNRLWFGTRNGLSLLQTNGRLFFRYGNDPANPSSLSDSHLMSLYQDRGGVIWVGTRTGGINRWDTRTWQFGHSSQKRCGTGALSASDVTSFSEDSEGRLWIGTFGGGIDVMERATGRIVRYRHDPRNRRSLSSDQVMALVHDHRGALWAGTRDSGLNRFDPESKDFQRYRHDPDRSESLSTNGVMTLFVDSRGTLWVGTFGGGLDRFDAQTGAFIHHRHDPGDPNSLSSNLVTSIAEDREGDLWIGTEGGGLNRLAVSTGRFHRFRHDPKNPASLSGNTVLSLHSDASGSLWIGSMGGGLSLMLDESPQKAEFRHFSEKDGLVNEVVYGIVSDLSGDIWMSTNRGLSRFDPQSEAFKNYDSSHGLQAEEFHFGSAYRSVSGELFFGGVNGFNAFYPDRIESNTHAPPVKLTAFLLFNRPAPAERSVAELQSIDLGYRDDVVTFEFAGLDYSSPERNRFAYKLEGFDRDWIDLGTVHRVTFTDLDGGDYVLKVKAANNDGLWNEDGLELAIRVDPPPWRTWYAYAGYLIAILSLLVASIGFHRRRLEREEAYSRRLERDVGERTEQLAQRAQELENLNEELKRVSLTDSLTGLANRRFLFEYLQRESALVKRRYHDVESGALTVEHFDLTFLMVDLDDFKAINDSHGHLAGDHVLTQVRDVLEDACRRSDILVRWGGDEFLVLARDSKPGGLDRVAERIRSQIEAHAFTVDDGQVVRTSCSIGFACYPFIPAQFDAVSWEQVISIADRALYAVKNTSRNAWLGLLSTDRTMAADLLQAVREEPGRLVQAGCLEIHTSIPQGRQIRWA